MQDNCTVAHDGRRVAGDGPSVVRVSSGVSSTPALYEVFLIACAQSGYGTRGMYRSPLVEFSSCWIF